MTAPLASYRADFPVLEEQLYFNHAGVAPTSTRAAAAVRAWMDDLVGHGVRHERHWEAHCEAVRAQAAQLLGAGPDEVAFVRNTSHGLGLVAEGLDWQPGDEVAVASSIEYPSNVYPWLHLASRGVRVREVEPSASGGVKVEAVARALTPRTRLVAVSSVQFASGVQTDLEALGALCARAGVLLCVDGIQSVGCVPVDVKRCRIHFLSADSHKWMLGVSGIGLLYVDAGVLPRLRPVLVGWRSTTDAWNFNRAHFELRPDARKLEEGSAAYTGIYALGAALGLLQEVGMERVAERIRECLVRLEGGLTALGCEVGPAPAERAGILTFVPPPGGRSAAELSAHLGAQGVSHSLRRERVRLSPHFYTLDAEVDRVVELVRGFVG
ncbi:aminotransferase class V-fold PLP-dependent enzyme [Aggregicoccus sp. 17bor-14]|uniref:aminotransferase class V-fold PLP-dependent enzyme n=1 Tax=Myxococcaceae TaxID=31 RepID=UPI00129C4C13|nr:MULTISPECIES: aminotransferase class V-fold PLP-dependent enzyme [Myxococcaceae]MBF5043478.1 aminotransferase class V-fold PLP-dependent enzyme [Simulacricoccus sp. 17bor-14]MRI89236.1 aminotransferase class V-fold PLP-dependent enzyme [Aggregicoccus sp. 17bor-14]